MNQEIIDLYDEYTHKPLSRPEFMSRLALLTGGMAAALSILPMIEVNAAKANITADDDLEIETITYEGVNGTMSAYVAKPKGKKKLAAVVVIHENRGLNAHIEDVARRAAKAGYLAIAPNILSPLGELPKNDDELRAKFATLKAEESLQNFIRAFNYLSTRKDCNGQFGCVGFCWGGAMANNLAVNVPNLKAAVAYYGRQPEASKVAQIKSAVMLHYGGLDTRVNEGIPTYEAALKENKINYELFVYENVNHAFHNDTAGARYNETAAKLSWERTLGFFAKYLK
ncbi:MAG TPA: dienelactone hydrolase family protein [Sediminibacterium sp.]|uniref:dienelactone hydrolase family protein n=1 Tax=Sediminibacterium sp. TaxID=1917865 RepID=UPI0008D82204|nr:dienelactone hydrolase family protein [Sediminibacterium sp.]OHC85521.1 MAG: carboxymethylenebutenolidase [Sphingobacteriia bacterium RIFOXYC2_FULL_35_18]OHC87717.1 MAG: carboxymethylenebutenolidase [Sphingobacteriia bacterium RIFOXYD2_FULL_35_12]OYW78663.1 MAG: carboxymethylenebutenolidase [Sphingobacteriia bacterium 32-37-4]HLD52850.1 dienelactone hydrolase family protein [Sediminibacterium sp.]